MEGSLLFKDQLFSAFQEEGVEERLMLIRNRIDPFFEDVEKSVLPILNAESPQYHAFIAKHARRHRNPPPNTWVAFGKRTRGYKMVPHYEVGIWCDQLFIWLACEVNILDRSQIIQMLTHKKSQFLELRPLFYLSTNHMLKEETPLIDDAFSKAVLNYGEKRQTEVLIGRVLGKDDPILEDKKRTLRAITDTIIQLSTIWDK